MNGFIDIREDQWEKNELRKAQLAKDLRQQMEEQKEKKEHARHIQLAEEAAIEKKLLREREELKIREITDMKKAQDKNENRRLTALKFAEEQERIRQEAIRKAENEA